MFLAIAILVLVLCGCVPAFAQSNEPIINGGFEYSALELDRRSPYFLRGYIVNKTDRYWKAATFQVFLYDKTGKAIRDPLALDNIFTVDNLKRGERRAIGPTLRGERLLSVRKTRPARFEIVFINGVTNANYNITLIEPGGSNNLQFEDDLISIGWSFNKLLLSLSLQNRTDAPIRVNWQQALFVDVNGTAEKVLRLGARNFGRGNIRASTLIPPRGNIQDSLLPTSMILNNIEEDGRLRVKPMFPDGVEGLTYKGKSFWVFIPIESNQKTKNYLFVFRITNVTL